MIMFPSVQTADGYAVARAAAPDRVASGRPVEASAAGARIV